MNTLTLVERLYNLIETNPTVSIITFGVVVIVIIFKFKKLIEKIIAKKFDVEDVKAFGRYLEKRTKAEITDGLKRKDSVEYTMGSKVHDWLETRKSK